MRLLITASPTYTHPPTPMTPNTPLTLPSPTNTTTTILFTSHPSSRPSATFSLTLTTTFTRPIPLHHLTWGNDFDRPIRDRLPWGWKTGIDIVRWVADPGLEEGLEEEKPWVRGPAGGSFNRIHISPSDSPTESSSSGSETGGWKVGMPVREGWEGLREEDQDWGRVEKADFEKLRGVAGDGDGAMKARREWLRRGGRVVLPVGREVRWEFFNGFLDLERFTLNLPGFKLNILKYWDGQPIRFVLKEIDPATGKDGEVFAVISFTLVDDDAEDDTNGSETSGNSDEFEDARSGSEESGDVVKEGANDGKTGKDGKGGEVESESELD